MPFETVLGSNYDSGEFEKNLDDALEAANWNDLSHEGKKAKKQWKSLGIGLASYIERCAGGSPEQARLEVSKKGHVTLYIGTLSNGQGHETAFRQILCESLGIAFEDVSIVQGNSDLVETGGGTMGSRSVPVGGSAIGSASKKIIEKAKETAAELLESAVSDIEFDRGAFKIVGTDRIVDFQSVAETAAGDSSVAFDEKESFAPEEATYLNGTHVCELEIDMATVKLSLSITMWLTTSARLLTHCYSRARSTEELHKGSGKQCLKNANMSRDQGSSCPQVSWITQCLAPTIFLRSNLKEMRCPAKQTHWA